jgi:hypothetical protein
MLAGSLATGRPATAPSHVAPTSDSSLTAIQPQTTTDSIVTSATISTSARSGEVERELAEGPFPQYEHHYPRRATACRGVSGPGSAACARRSCLVARSYKVSLGRSQRSTRALPWKRARAVLRCSVSSDVHLTRLSKADRTRRRASRRTNSSAADSWPVRLWTSAMAAVGSSCATASLAMAAASLSSFAGLWYPKASSASAAGSPAVPAAAHAKAEGSRGSPIGSRRLYGRDV